VNVHTPDENIFQDWAQRLRQWRLNQFAAAFLEASGPLNLVGAQMVYLGQPVLSSVLPDHQLQALAAMLEEPDNTQAFIHCLREEPA
jgi:hypothetical protein